MTVSSLSFETNCQVTLYSVIMPLGSPGACQVKLSCENDRRKSSTLPAGPGANKDRLYKI